MDLQNITLVGLVAFGTVNVLSFFYPKMDSKVKFSASFLVAFGITFIPVDTANVILNHAKEALAAAFALSGVYKIADKAGGN